MEFPDPEKTKSYLELLASAWNGLAAQTKKYDLFGRIQKQYQKLLLHKVKDQYVFGKHKPVPVKDFFIQVKILDNICRDEQRDVDAVAAREKQLNRENEISHEPQDSLEVIEKYEKVFVLGKPGGRQKRLFAIHCLCRHQTGNEHIKLTHQDILKRLVKSEYLLIGLSDSLF